MSFDFQEHLFISYAHLDNKSATSEEDGWITQFHKYLHIFLSQNLGQDARIWRDERLRGNEKFANEIEEQFPKTAALVSILTPSYIESDWCVREVKAFCKAAEENGGLFIENKTRFFKVLHQPIERENQLPIMQEILGYEFFVRKGERFLPLDPNFGKDIAEIYRRRIYMMSQDIALTLNHLFQRDPHKDAQTEKTTKTCIYLAECSYDRKEDREKILMELREHGFDVLPRQQLSNQEDKYIQEVDYLLDFCSFSIHIVGSAYGTVLDGPSRKSNIILQNSIAARKSVDKSLQRLIWIPDGIIPEHQEQKEFVDSLHQDATLQRGADLLRGDIETFKNTIHTVLKKIDQQDRNVGQSDQIQKTTNLIFLICDKSDRKEIIPIMKCLRAQGFEVKLPSFSGDASTIRKANDTLMLDSQGIILYWGNGTEAWRIHQENEIRKYIGLRKKTFNASYIYLGNPSTEDKEFLVEIEEPNVIDGRDGFFNSLMKSFIEDLRK